MAGKKQHFVPQFLQKGFADKSTSGSGFGKKSKKKKKVSVWVFDSQQKSYCTSTENKGAERFFYGLEDSTVDTAITESETKYASLVHQLRQHTSSTSLASSRDAVAELVSHLFVRTKHVRDSGKEAFDIMLNMLEQIQDAANFKSFMRNSIKANSSMIADDFKKRFREATPEQQQIISTKLKENPNLISDLFEVMVEGEYINNPFNEEPFTSFREESASFTKDAHIKALEGSIAPKVRTEQLSQLNWFIYFERDADFILGDEVVFCRTASGQYGPIVNASSETNCIFIPISSEHVLIGATVDDIPSINSSLLNEENAAISREFFIANQSTQREKFYASLIGKKSSITSSIEMDAIEDEFQKEWLA